MSEEIGNILGISEDSVIPISRRTGRCKVIKSSSAQTYRGTGFGFTPLPGCRSGTELNAFFLKRQSLCETKKKHIYPLNKHSFGSQFCLNSREVQNNVVVFRKTHRGNKMCAHIHMLSRTLHFTKGSIKSSDRVSTLQQSQYNPAFLDIWVVKKKNKNRNTDPATWPGDTLATHNTWAHH